LFSSKHDNHCGTAPLHPKRSHRTGSDRSATSRSHSSFQRRHLHRSHDSDPGPLRAHTPGTCARLGAGSLFIQCRGWALRGVRWKRWRAHRDALPQRCVDPMRGLSWSTL
jgi:hypothetical protein